MILSMTGFGEAQLEEDGHAYHVDIRSVNHRYFKPSIRLPEDFAFMEAPLERLLRERLRRGAVTFRFYVRDLSESAAQDINLAAVQHYIAQLREIMASEPRFSVDLATMATLPGVCQPHEMSEQMRERSEAVIQKLSETAIENLLEMRAAEGNALALDLKQHCAVIAEHVGAIREAAPGIIVEYRNRLLARVEQLVAGSNVQFAADDLLKEVSVFAERSDVSEELSRLASHLEQFESALSEQQSAGRKLEFISQEMLREANTIGSKAGDATIARHVIEIKGSIDRVKEQVQNVE